MCLREDWPGMTHVDNVARPISSIQTDSPDVWPNCAGLEPFPAIALWCHQLFLSIHTCSPMTFDNVYIVLARFVITCFDQILSLTAMLNFLLWFISCCQIQTKVRGLWGGCLLTRKSLWVMIYALSWQPTMLIEECDLHKCSTTLDSQRQPCVGMKLLLQS